MEAIIVLFVTYFPMTFAGFAKERQKRNKNNDSSYPAPYFFPHYFFADKFCRQYPFAISCWENGNVMPTDGRYPGKTS